MFVPWAFAEERHIEVSRIPLRPLSGYTDSRRIWLDHRLTATEARCALTHELIHLARGHDRHQPPAVENRVRADTARLLVPWAAITAHAGSQLNAWHLAQKLGVTERVLADRLQHASATEIAELRCAAG
ncbi:ImmA/IrrE family metallo-endopeptidase [Kocuria sp. KD4]|uniref:ImmA/IrrE family metallo-endopeptidase n=1 Tax=Kocuria sp. KD4 TaxID=2719588 RepID=UPI0014277689|nr:ImmA/IrrE family metallo-endopeptidase [Kocuria sp. KD4]QIR69608.1 ImmA/IrrE family metallo-endopeptidase [Kocuria sp. KD4]